MNFDHTLKQQSWSWSFLMSAFSPVKISFSQYCICCYGWQECSWCSLNKDHISYWRVPFTSKASFSAVPYCTVHFSSPPTSLLHSISSNSSKLSFCISCHLPNNEKGGREQFSFSLHRLSMQQWKAFILSMPRFPTFPIHFSLPKDLHLNPYLLPTLST